MTHILQESASWKPLALLASSAAHTARAARLAQRLHLPMLETGTDPVNCSEAGILLVVGGEHLSLQKTGKGAPGPVAVNFGSGGMRHRRRGGSAELLGRAVGLGKKSPLRILDATAGLGRDAFVLADLGCEVLLCERDPVIAEMLRDELEVMPQRGDPWLDAVRPRLTLHPGDAQAVPAHRLRDVDVFYLDPMFPPRSKSAAVKKDMLLFQLLLDHNSHSPDADSLLRWALDQDTARVVVKRPLRAPNLAALPPSHCIRGKAVRFDVYVRRKITQTGRDGG